MGSAEPFFARLSTLDDAFLATESECCPMHVGAVLVLDTEPVRDDGRGVDMTRIARFVEGTVAKEPRFRQRLRKVPGLHEHVWVDDAHFLLRYHLHHVALPHPGTERQLKRLAGHIFSSRLDRRRPLWEFWIVEGLEGDRFALICKVHHCLTDGVGSLSILASMMGSEPVDLPVPKPRPEPAGSELLAATLRHRGDGLRWMKTGMKAMQAAGAAVRPGGQRNTPLAGLMHTARTGIQPAHRTCLNPHSIGPHRRFDTLHMDLAAVKAIKNALGGKVNDVVLTALTLGLQRHLARHGEHPAPPFRALVPASVRAPDGARLGNWVSSLITDLPIGEPDPRRCYDRVRETTGWLKAGSRAVEGMRVAEQMDDALGLGLVSAAFRISARLRSFNVIATNIAGPAGEVSILGAPLRELYALVPLFRQQALGVTVFSYAGKLHWGFNADWDTVDDLHDLVLDVRDAFEELRLAAHPTDAAPAGAPKGRSRAMGHKAPARRGDTS